MAKRCEVGVDTSTHMAGFLCFSVVNVSFFFGGGMYIIVQPSIYDRMYIYINYLCIIYIFIYLFQWFAGLLSLIVRTQHLACVSIPW